MVMIIVNLGFLLILPPSPTLPALGPAHPAPPPMHARLISTATAPLLLLLADIVRGPGRWCPCPAPWRQLKGWCMTTACRSLSAPSPPPLTPCHPLPPCSTSFLSFTLTSAGHRASPKPRQ